MLNIHDQIIKRLNLKSKQLTKPSQLSKVNFAKVNFAKMQGEAVSDAVLQGTFAVNKVIKHLLENA